MVSFYSMADCEPLKLHLTQLFSFVFKHCFIYEMWALPLDANSWLARNKLYSISNDAIDNKGVKGDCSFILCISYPGVQLSVTVNG